jgi:hypothetical protein
VVVVVLAIASVAVVSMVANVGVRQSDNSDLQVGAQLLQECGEWIVTNHRRVDNFFTATFSTSANCYSLTTYGGFSAPTVTVTNPYTGVGCPTGATCGKAVISLAKSGVSLQPVELILVRYNPL